MEVKQRPTPNGCITLSPAQIERLERAIVRYPGRTFVDQGGITRTTAACIDGFISDLARYHRTHGYLTTRQYACIAHIVEES